MADQTSPSNIHGTSGAPNPGVLGLIKSHATKYGKARLDWNKLLCDKRYPYKDERADKSEVDQYRTNFESDYDRVVFSRPFRRLARKTQVHPMALNDHVHNRLTHSIEVASVARSFGRRIAKFLKEKGKLPNGREENDLVWILMASCAAHDIGNPPFGHAGEEAISNWAAIHEDIVFATDVDESLKNDVLLFEGNAQGFRIASRSDHDFTGNLRLTYATLGAMVKYPWCSQDARANEHKGKYNYFSTEKDIFKEVFHELGLSIDDKFVRHPLSFLSEAADDICYRVLDLEDAVELNIVERDLVFKVFNQILKPNKIQDTQQPLSELRGPVITSLIEACWKVFEENYEKIMTGQRYAPLKEDLLIDIKEALEDIKKIYEQVFSQHYKVLTELGAYKSLGRTIKAMCLAIQDLQVKQDWNELAFVSKRCFDLEWKKGYVEKHMNKDYAWWLHQVLDYVAGMTDNYAMRISKGIEGT